MLKLSKDSIIDFETYLEDLSELGFVYVDKEDLTQCIQLLDAEVNTLRYLCSNIMSVRTGYYLRELTKRNIVMYLKEYEKCPDYMFNAKGVEGDSLSTKKVLNPLREKGMASYFIDYYIEYVSKKRTLSSLQGICERLIESDAVDNDGRPLHKLKFSYKEKENLRVYTYNHNVQGMPKMACSSIKARKGYVLVSGDFKQSDLRIAASIMLLTPENYPVLTGSEDMYEGFMRVLMGDSFDKEDFTENRKVYKQCALAPLYGAMSASSPKESEIIKRARKVLDVIPPYREYNRRIDRKLDLGVPLEVRSYFGNKKVVDEVADPYKNVNVQRKNYALNSPVQTGTSEIVISVERAIMEEFAKQGVTPYNDGIHAYLNRHDELIFELSLEHIDKAWIFQKYSRVQVDNWVKLEIDFNFTRNYTVEDEEIQKLAENYYRSDITLENQVVVKPDFNNFEYFIPTSDVLELFIGIRPIGRTGKIMISFLDANNNTCSFRASTSQNPDDILSIIKTTIGENTAYLRSKDFDAVNVCTNLVAGTTMEYGGMIVVFTNNGSSHSLIKALLLAEFAANKVDPEHGQTIPPSTYLENNLAYAESVVNKGTVFND